MGSVGVHRRCCLGPLDSPDAGSAAAHRAPFLLQHWPEQGEYRLVLQVGEVFKRWRLAEPPGFDPERPQIAIEVEELPPSQAAVVLGDVVTIDHGLWSDGPDALAELARGRLHLELFGQRLRGAWRLYRSDGANNPQSNDRESLDDGTASPVRWELGKLPDAFAAPSADSLILDDAGVDHAGAESAGASSGSSFAVDFTAQVANATHARQALIDPRAFGPQLARQIDRPPDGDSWLHEVKWDGYRLLATIVGGRVRLWSRNGLDWTGRFPDIVQALADLELESARLDGEVIAVEGGRSDFGALQATLSGQLHRPLVYVLFDAPYLQGFDLRRTPLIERKMLLERVLLAHPSDHLQFSAHLRGGGGSAFASADRRGLEGIVSKRMDAGYRAGRGDNWLKIKRLDSDEFAIVGFTAPKGARAGFGSLLLARPDPQGWRYVGRVGTGFTDRTLEQVAAELTRFGQTEPTAKVTGIDPLLRGARWVPPERVAEVYYRGMGRLGLLRQPSLKGLRPDKRAAELRESVPSAGRVRRTLKRSTAVTISHPERVVFPEQGYSKQAVADYYRSVLDWIVPGLLRRPLSVLRCPGGLAEPCFFQKHWIDGLQRVSAIRLREGGGGAAEYLYVDDPEGVIELVQFGVVEFHPWGCTVADPERADRLVFDLDPGPGVAWKRLAAAARAVRDRLSRLGLKSYLRATGGAGLHVLLPLKPAVEWPLALAFSRALAESMARNAPEQLVAHAAKPAREGRIYIDYLRNVRGATAVASYSLRARPGAPVAVPLRWDELSRLDRADSFSLHSVPRRLARLDADPWEDMEHLAQSLPTLENPPGRLQ